MIGHPSAIVVWRGIRTTRDLLASAIEDRIAEHAAASTASPEPASRAAESLHPHARRAAEIGYLGDLYGAQVPTTADRLSESGE